MTGFVFNFRNNLLKLFPPALLKIRIQASDKVAFK